MSAPLQSMFESPIAEDFEIRSFPKGISQRRIVVRDAEDGIKLTIAQVREAAVELVKLGGMAAAHEFALVAAASALAMGTARDAIAIAARETMEAARSAYAWFAWGDVMVAERGSVTCCDSGADLHRHEMPPILAFASRLETLRWRQVSRAA